MSTVNANVPSPTNTAPAAGAQPSSNQATGSTITNVASGARPNKVLLQASYQALVNGLQSSYEPTDTFNTTQGTYTRDELIAQFNTFIGTGETTKAARQEWLAATQAEQAGLLQVAPLRAAVRSVLQARFGTTGLGLSKFGFTPGKTPKKSTTTKAGAVAKTKATRAARHTMGKVQKQAITGDVVGITVTPLVAGPPTPALGSTTPSAPAASTPAGSATPASPGGGAPASGASVTAPPGSPNH
jgi:hypothetical protein